MGITCVGLCTSALAQTSLFRDYFIETTNFSTDTSYMYVYRLEMLNPALDTVSSFYVEADSTPLQKYGKLQLDSMRESLTFKLTYQNTRQELPVYFPYHPNFYVQDETGILTRGFTSEGEELVLKSDQRSEFLVQRFADDFELARPPMATGPDNGSATLKIDTSWQAKTNETLSLSPGTYFISTDKQSPGRSLLVTDSLFPHIRRIEDLVDPMVYISTREEFNDLSTSNTPKLVFDKFWLSKTSSEDIARNMIREYFSRVRMANSMFTTFKEGWKTDPGMLYIVFGPPDRIYHMDKDLIEWVYVPMYGMPSIRFRMMRVSTPLAPNYYVLIRKKSYESYWYQMIELWRSGKIKSGRVPSN